MPKRRTRRGRWPRLIDCHGHVNWYGYDAERLVANMDAHGIDLMWLLTWEVLEHEMDPLHREVFPPGQTQMPFADVLAAVSRHPTRFVPFYAPDPRHCGPSARQQWRRQCKPVGSGG